jgi:integrase
MGTLIKIWKTIPMPEGAKIGRNGSVTWTVKGKKRTGKLSTSPGRVTVQSDTWTAHFTDENGKVQRISTKTTVRSVAEKILVRYQTEVDRIRTGVATRDELSKIHLRHVTLAEAKELYKTKLVADGGGSKYIDLTLYRVARLCEETGIESLTDIRRETVVKWIADEVEKKVLAPGTINGYIKVTKSFAQYLADIELLPNNPLKSIRKLNQEIGKRKNRRAMTVSEIASLLKVAVSDESSGKWKTGERALVYRLFLGTGLRSTELSLLTPNQIDFERNGLRIEAAKTKNKKADVLPMRPDLVQSVKEWVTKHGIQPHERIFRFDNRSMCQSFYEDLKVAGIERIGKDGRSVDIHALRKTFGTMLARAGVPLTTTQRLMRHSSPVITAQLYIDVDPLDMSRALEQLPVF